MSKILHAGEGGTLSLPDTVLCDRADGGHLVVHPPRVVWERSELQPHELAHWSLLVAAAGRALLDVLPCLAGGCLNYWEAGNWALNDAAEPAGPKSPQSHRRVHLHVFGRSPRAVHPDWRWGESPRFPAWTEARAWAAQFRPLTSEECEAVAERVGVLLAGRFRLADVPGAAA